MRPQRIKQVQGSGAATGSPLGLTPVNIFVGSEEALLLKKREDQCSTADIKMTASLVQDKRGECRVL